MVLYHFTEINVSGSILVPGKIYFLKNMLKEQGP